MKLSDHIPLMRPAQRSPAGRDPPDSPLRVAMVDTDQKASRDLCAALQQLAPAWKFECHFDFAEAADELVRAPPSAVLMEVGGEDLQGIECTRRLKATVPDLPVVMVTARSDAGSVFLSIMAGADGYLIRPVSARAVLRPLDQALHAKSAFSTQSQRLLFDHIRVWSSRASQPLSSREHQVLGCLFENLVDKDIVMRLHIEYSTVHAHLESIYRKLHVHDRHQAVRKCLGFQ